MEDETGSVPPVDVRRKETGTRNGEKHAPIGFKAVQGTNGIAGRKDLEAVEPSFIPFENDSCIGSNEAPTGHVCVVVNVKSRAFLWFFYLNVLYVCTETSIKPFIDGYKGTLLVCNRKEFSRGHSEVVHTPSTVGRNSLEHVELSHLPSVHNGTQLIGYAILIIWHSQEGISVDCEGFNTSGPKCV